MEKIKLDDLYDDKNEDWSEVDPDQMIESAIASLGYIRDSLSGNAMSYEDSRVARYEDDEQDLFVSTIYAQDVRRYETAIHHPLYYEDLIIVEYYDNIQKAEAGHAHWVAMVSGAELMPDSIKSVQSGIIYHRKEEE